MKQCTKCGQTKPLANFNTRPDRPSGYRSECRRCQYDRMNKRNQRRHRSPEHYRAYNIAHYAKKKGKIISVSACEECGKSGRLIMHHDDYKLPLNVKWLCYQCHAKVHIAG